MSSLLVAFFTYINVSTVRPCCLIYQHFIPFYGQILFHCMSISHVNLTHSSIDGHLDGSTLQLLWITLLWTFTHKFLCRHMFPFLSVFVDACRYLFDYSCPSRQYLVVVSVCISLTADYLEHLFMYLLAIRVSLEKCLLTSFAHLGYWSFYCWVVRILSVS